VHLSADYFWGRRRVGVNADRRHHSEDEHDERHMVWAAMPGAGLVMIEAEFILGGLETIFDRPAASLDFRQRFDGCSERRRGSGEGEFAVGDVLRRMSSQRVQTLMSVAS